MNWLLLLLLLLHLFYAALLLVLRVGYSLAGRRNQGFVPEVMPKVSVLVPFRNEEVHLAGVINDLLIQDYPHELLEIICIDDHSSDRGPEIATSHGHRVKLLRLPDTETGKKAALKAGVSVSDSEWILTTDADCRLSAGWVSSLIKAGQRSDACMVCGNVAIGSSTGMLGVFQTLETHLLQRMGSASLALGFPLLNTGASLAFRRDAFLEVGGYEGNRHVASGDDTFLMLAMHVAHPGRVIPCGAPAARVRTAAEPSWSAFFAQRRRRASKVRHYRSPGIAVVGLILSLGQFATLVALGAWVASAIDADTLVLILALRFLPEFLLLRGLRPLRFWLAAVPLSLLFPLLNIPAVWPIGTEKLSWKGRPLVNKKH